MINFLYFTKTFIVLDKTGNKKYQSGDQQYFINERNNDTYIDVIVNFRSNDAVFGYCNDYIWSKYVLELLATDLSRITGHKVNVGRIWWNAGSLHIYERHFKHLEKLMSNE